MLTTKDRLNPDCDPSFESFNYGTTIQPLNMIANVYSIEVENNNNFIVNGILVKSY